MSYREKNQADFDLERVVELFDQALTSKDERVVNALRSLLMIVALTDPEAGSPRSDLRVGPFRQLQDEIGTLRSRLSNLEMEVSQLRNPPIRGGSQPWPYEGPGGGYGYGTTYTGTNPNQSEWKVK